jgi:hypothetical protein
MKAIQGYHLIKPEDLFWRPSNLMRILNADYLKRTGKCMPHGPPCLVHATLAVAVQGGRRKEP